jgi:hypothetical protein
LWQETKRKRKRYLRPGKLDRGALPGRRFKSTIQRFETRRGGGCKRARRIGAETGRGRQPAHLPKQPPCMAVVDPKGRAVAVWTDKLSFDGAKQPANHRPPAVDGTPALVRIGTERPEALAPVFEQVPFKTGEKHRPAAIRTTGPAIKGRHLPVKLFKFCDDGRLDHWRIQKTGQSRFAGNPSIKGWTNERHRAQTHGWAMPATSMVPQSGQ